MRAINGKNNVLCLISSTEAKVFNMIAADQFTDLNKLEERDLYLAEELYKRNAVRKVRRGQAIGYKIYDQHKAV